MTCPGIGDGLPSWAFDDEGNEWTAESVKQVGVNDVHPVSVNDAGSVGSSTVFPQGGYVCSKCGTWVAPNMVHACTGIAQPPPLPWQWPSKTTTCDHCYCLTAAAADDHKQCCKCADTRLEKFVGKDGR